MIDESTKRRLAELQQELAIKELHEQELRAFYKSRPPRRRPIGRLKPAHLKDS